MGTERNVFEAVVMGQSVKLSGNMSGERMSKICEYIEEKAREIQKLKRGLSVNAPLFRLLVNLNIADDLFTAREQNTKLKARAASLERELAKARQEIKDYEELFDKEG